MVGRYDPDRQRSYFANLIQCDKPLCPVCGYRRAERTRHELSVALAQADKLDYFPVMVTVTLRHHKGDSVSEMKAALASAWDKTFSGRWYDELCAEYVIAGKTKSWETTFGKHGWHPHIHALIFMGLELAGASLDEFRAKLWVRYSVQLEKLGFTASEVNGLDVRTADSDIADYISKFECEPKVRTWGADAEIAMSPVKKAHFDGLTPLELLDAADGQSEALQRLSEALGVDDHDQLKAQAGALWCELYDAFERTAQIHWGKSLREALHLDAGEWGTGALADFEAKNPVEHDDEDMVLIERGDEWGRVLRLPNGRADLRAAIRTGDAFKVLAWLGLHGIAGIVSEAALARSADPERIPARSSVWTSSLPPIDPTEIAHVEPITILPIPSKEPSARPPAGASPLPPIEPLALPLAGLPLVQQWLFPPEAIRKKYVYV